MEILFGIVFLLFCAAVYFLLEYWWVLLIIVCVVGFVALIVWIAYFKSLEKIVFAKIVGRQPIIERVSEKTGHTTSYGRSLSYHEHYRDKNVITGYNVTFLVEYENNRVTHITCKEDSIVYNKLLRKAK